MCELSLGCKFHDPANASCVTVLWMTKTADALSALIDLSFFYYFSPAVLHFFVLHVLLFGDIVFD